MSWSPSASAAPSSPMRIRQWHLCTEVLSCCVSETIFHYLNAAYGPSKLALWGNRGSSSVKVAISATSIRTMELGGEEQSGTQHQLTSTNRPLYSPLVPMNALVKLNFHPTGLRPRVGTGAKSPPQRPPNAHPAGPSSPRTSAPLPHHIEHRDSIGVFWLY